MITEKQWTTQTLFLGNIKWHPVKNKVLCAWHQNYLIQLETGLFKIVITTSVLCKIEDIDWNQGKQIWLPPSQHHWVKCRIGDPPLEYLRQQYLDWFKITLNQHLKEISNSCYLLIEDYKDERVFVLFILRC